MIMTITDKQFSMIECFSSAPVHHEDCEYSTLSLFDGIDD